MLGALFVGWKVLREVCFRPLLAGGALGRVALQTDTLRRGSCPLTLSAQWQSWDGTITLLMSGAKLSIVLREQKNPYFESDALGSGMTDVGWLLWKAAYVSMVMHLGAGPQSADRTWTL